MRQLTIFTPEPINLRSRQQTHVAENRLSRQVQLEPILWRIAVTPVAVGPFGEESPRLHAAESIVIGDEAEEREDGG